MSKLILPDNEIVRVEGCRLCDEGNREVGNVGERGAVVYRSGENILEDWVVTLQRKNPCDQEKGFVLMMMPLGHLTTFSQVHSNRDLEHKYGSTFGITHYAIQAMRQEYNGRKDNEFRLTAASFGKCDSVEMNSQEHFHIKQYTLDGDVAQPSPTDTSWAASSTMPVEKKKMEETRYRKLALRLTEICGNA